MIKLCYKEYPFKMNLKACKAFYDDTGLDLQTVFMKYIAACSATSEMTLVERLVYFSELYSREIATKALHALIKQEMDGVSLAELEDATYRVGWLQSERNDDISEPWPFVMLTTALDINEYFSGGADAKKTDTSDDSHQS